MLKVGTKGINICQIGAGIVAKIRRQNYPEGTQVVALVVRNIPKYEKLVKTDPTLPKNVLATRKVEEVFGKFANDLIWDIVSDDKTHLEYVKKITKIDPKAKIILGKSPYNKKIIAELEKIFKQNPQVKITITENYGVSQVTAKVKELIKKYNFNAKKIIIEFTKNRIKDIEEGRFLHGDIGVLGYEGGHMITILAALDKNFTSITDGGFENLRLPSSKVLKNQGSAKILGYSKNCQIIFYTSMNGEILNKLPELEVTKDIGYGADTRHRILIVENGNKKIIGQYDPVPGMIERPFGKVWVKIGNKIMEKVEKIYDNTMRAILEQQICFLTGSGCSNPFPLQNANNFSILVKVFKRFAN